ncbi:glycosyltransferase domain-containing protein [Micromonospora sp. CA-248260]|uniref:glycosyltransferase domain-containing protein n=1 Tax=Micromonospora sp. CA-248260 TaxID=3239962 RepID=UPI003D9165FE
MRVITIATDLEHPFLRRLLEPSCAAAGLRLVVLEGTQKGFRPRDKRALLTEYLDRHVAPDELVMFTDAYDTLLLRGADHILDTYAGFPQRVVFSAESNCWPLGNVGLALHDSPPVRPYPYLNSGGFIGPAGDIVALSAKYPKPPSEHFPLLGRLRAHGVDPDRLHATSDQYHWMLVQLLEPDTVGLDHGAVLFENFAPAVANFCELSRWTSDFRTNGRQAASYRRERTRLESRLQSPSGAAQVHFASALAKTVVLDLLDEGQLPSWLAGVLPR